MSLRHHARSVLGVASLALLTGCGAAPADEANASGEEWPFSAMDAPAATAEEADSAAPVEVAIEMGAEGREGRERREGESGGSSAADPDGATEADPAAAADTARSEPMIHTPRQPVDFSDARFRRPEHVRGLYVNAWSAGSTARMDALIDLARRTEINAFVIDIKDATGYISHTTQVPLAHQIGATGERRIRDLPALLDRLEAEGIYPIARIVVVKDPILSEFRPEYAVQDTAGGVWIDSKEIIWLNPYSRDMWEYHVDIAREVAEMGFPEIQWDYIRFPDAPASDMGRAVFVGSDGVERADAIRGFLAYARESLSDLPVRSTADVFGVTTTFRRDVGIGQLWESFIDVVDVALPMIYPSHYWTGSFGYREPNAYPYEVVRRALRDALARSATVEGAGTTRPWLQDFTLGKPMYGGPEVRAQIQAAHDVGVREWILWNPSSRYTESALEPVEGFETEPLVRVAGVLAPVSRRYAVMDSIAALLSAPAADSATVDSAAVDSVAADSAAVGAAGDSLTDTLAADSPGTEGRLLDSATIRILPIDSVPVDSIVVDSMAVDTMPVDSMVVDTMPTDSIYGVRIRPAISGQATRLK